MGNREGIRPRCEASRSLITSCLRFLGFQFAWSTRLILLRRDWPNWRRSSRVIIFDLLGGITLQGASYAPTGTSQTIRSEKVVVSLISPRWPLDQKIVPTRIGGENEQRVAKGYAPAAIR